MLQWQGKWPAAWVFDIWPSEKRSSFLVRFPLTSILSLPSSPLLARWHLASNSQVITDRTTLNLSCMRHGTVFPSCYQEIPIFASLLLLAERLSHFPVGGIPPSSVWIAYGECMSSMAAPFGNKLWSQNCLG